MFSRAPVPAPQALRGRRSSTDSSAAGGEAVLQAPSSTGVSTAKAAAAASPLHRPQLPLPPSTSVAASPRLRSSPLLLPPALVKAAGRQQQRQCPQPFQQRRQGARTHSVDTALLLQQDSSKATYTAAHGAEAAARANNGATRGRFRQRASSFGSGYVGAAGDSMRRRSVSPNVSTAMVAPDPQKLAAAVSSAVSVHSSRPQSLSPTPRSRAYSAGTDTAAAAANRLHVATHLQHHLLQDANESEIPPEPTNSLQYNVPPAGYPPHGTKASHTPSAHFYPPASAAAAATESEVATAVLPVNAMLPHGTALHPNQQQQRHFDLRSSTAGGVAHSSQSPFAAAAAGAPDFSPSAAATQQRTAPLPPRTGSIVNFNYNNSSSAPFVSAGAPAPSRPGVAHLPVPEWTNSSSSSDVERTAGSISGEKALSQAARRRASAVVFTCPSCRRSVPLPLLQQFVHRHVDCFFGHAGVASGSSRGTLIRDVGAFQVVSQKGEPQILPEETAATAAAAVADLLAALRSKSAKAWGPVPPSFFSSPYNTQQWFLLS